MKKKLTAAEFVEAWQNAPNMRVLVGVSGMTGKGASCRATYLRKHGVPLKTFGRGGHATLDIATLAALAKKHAPKNGAAK